MATPASYVNVFDRLQSARARYVAVGGVATVLHGCDRPVADLDLVIDSSPNDAQHAMAALLAAGFTPTIPLPLNLLTVLRMFDGSQREVDVFVRYHIAFAELFSASRNFPVGDTSTVRVASREHVIRVKRIIGRPCDLEDIERLLSVAKVEKTDREDH